MMMAGKDRQTWIYHNGKLLLSYHTFKNDARDSIVITTTPNLKMQRVGYYNVTGIYFQAQINEKFVYNCIDLGNGFDNYIDVSTSLTTTDYTGEEISKGEHTIAVKEPGLYYIIFKINDNYKPLIFSELFVI